MYGILKMVFNYNYFIVIELKAIFNNSGEIIIASGLVTSVIPGLFSFFIIQNY